MSQISQTTGIVKSDLFLLGSLVKFSHSIFALPFALSMFLVVAKFKPVTFSQLLWILCAMISARTAAMGFNRILDRHIDALNPRTQNREIPSNLIRCFDAWRLVFISSVIFLFSSWFLGMHCLTLAPLVLGFLFFYSYTKRFTKYAHIILGVALSMAPGGVWYALTAEFAFLPVVMMLAVIFWVAGFDIIYSCQDVDFDISNSLFSFPSVLGIEKSLFFSKFFHLVSIGLLFCFGYFSGLGIFYYTGVTIFSVLLLSQHAMVSSNNLSKINAAFFTRNGLASFIYFLGVLTDFLIHY